MTLKLMMPKKLNFFTILFLTGLGYLFSHASLSAAPEGAPVFAAADAVDEAATITLDFKEADINTVLRVMSLKSKINIVAGPEVQGNVTIRLENVPWEKALQVVLRTYGYVYERDGNIIRVTTRENLAAEPLVTQTFILNYTKATEIQNAVQDMLTERGRIKTAERTNMIVISDIPTNLYTMSEIIKKLDKVTPQAYIDSKVLKTDVGATENLGIDWKTGGSNNLGSVTGSSRPTTFPFPSSTNLGADEDGEGRQSLPTPLNQFFPFAGAAAVNPRDARDFPLSGTTTSGGTYTFGTMSFSGFNAVLQMLKSRSNTKIVSNPRIVVLNNQTAKVQVGQQIPLATFERNSTTGAVEVSGYTYRDVGVVMNVTPHINAEEEILVDLKPEVSAQNGSFDFGEFNAPIFDVTTALTQVLVRSGETIAIGGLMTDNVQIDENKVPYLSDIPLAGKLFRSKRQTAGSGNKKVETLFFVTVTMVDTEGQPSGSVVQQKKDRRKAELQDAATADTAAKKAQDIQTVSGDSQDASPIEESEVKPENKGIDDSGSETSETTAAAV